MNGNKKFALIFGIVGLFVGLIMSSFTGVHPIMNIIIGTLAGAVVGYLLNSFVLKK